MALRISIAFNYTAKEVMITCCQGRWNTDDLIRVAVGVVEHGLEDSPAAPSRGSSPRSPASSSASQDRRWRTWTRGSPDSPSGSGQSFRACGSSPVCLRTPSKSTRKRPSVLKQQGTLSRAEAKESAPSESESAEARGEIATRDSGSAGPWSGAGARGGAACPACSSCARSPRR